MKTDLLKKLLDELGIKSIPEDSVWLAMKKAIGNSIYWFCFKRENLVKNINFAARMLSIVCLSVLFIAGTFISIMPFSNRFINSHIGLYLFFGLCAALVVMIVLEGILVKITSWRQKARGYTPNLNDPLRKIFDRIENMIVHSYNSGSEYYRRGICLAEQRVNKLRFVFVRDRDNNRFCINISAIETE